MKKAGLHQNISFLPMVLSEDASFADPGSIGVVNYVVHLFESEKPSYIGILQANTFYKYKITEKTLSITDMNTKIS